MESVLWLPRRRPMSSSSSPRLQTLALSPGTVDAYPHSAADLTAKSQPLRPLLDSSLPRPAEAEMRAQAGQTLLPRRASVSAATPSIIRVVRSALRRFPFVSNCLALGGMYTAAELSQQTMNNSFTRLQLGDRPKEMHDLLYTDDDFRPPLPDEPFSRVRRVKATYDWESVKRYATLGTFLFAPMYVTWYHYLDRALPGSAAAVVVRKTLLDQFVLGPPALAIFFVANSWMEGQDDLTAELRKKYVYTYACDCLFWIPVQAVNFKYVPNHLRVVYLGVAGFVWLNILCFIKNFESYYKVMQAKSKKK